MMQQHRIFLAIVATVLGLLSFLVEVEVIFSIADYNEVAQREEHHRSLRPAQYFDRNSPVPRINSTITVYLVNRRSSKWPNRAYSIFQTDILLRYSSGGFDFRIKEHSRCDLSCKQPVVDNTPCLAVVRVEDCGRKYLECTYPQCKTMVTNDENCEVYSHDVRGYYSANLSNKAYLPLGPRIDSWKSFQKIQSSPQFYMKHASKRQFAFNAIFSQSTNTGRIELAKIIKEEQEKSNLPIFTTMAKKWRVDPDHRRAEQLNTDSYVKVLFDSVFTLSPGGRNPECYRLFEAVEAGTIPVLIKKDLYFKTALPSKCKESLHHWYDAPILVLDSWEDLFPTVERLMGDPEALDKMQVEIRMWYDEYMHKVVGEFEDYMFESYVEEKVKEDLGVQVAENVIVIDSQTDDATVTESQTENIFAIEPHMDADPEGTSTLIEGSVPEESKLGFMRLVQSFQERSRISRYLQSLQERIGINRDS